MKLKNILILTITIAIFITITILGIYGLNIGGNVVWKKFTQIKTGLDISGGVQIVYQAKQDGAISKTDLDKAKTVLSVRLENKNIYDYTVRVDYDKSLIYLEIPVNAKDKTQDPLSVVQGLDKTAKIEFRDPIDNVVISGTDIKTAEYSEKATNESGLADPHVILTLTDEGKKKFADATEKLIGQYIGIFMDSDPISVPRVSERIDTYNPIITMGNQEYKVKKEEAQQLSNLIASGALPFTLSIINKEYVGPFVGYHALNLCIYAGIVGLIIISIFMLFVYRLPGLIANITLYIYVALFLTILAQTGITLTLPGIAGLVLSIGMAVDANVIIFERLKEEIRLGRSVTRALDNSYSRAMIAILDSNITTLIAAFMLYIFGIGSVKGFGIVLALGTVLSMFTAITISKHILRQIVGVAIKNIGLFISRKEITKND